MMDSIFIRILIKKKEDRITIILLIFPLIHSEIIAVLWYSTTRMNPVISKPFLKCYFSYWVTLFNSLFSFWLVGCSSFMIGECYTMWWVSSRWSVLESLLMVVVLLVSCFVILNSIDYISFMESYLFLFFQLLIILTPYLLV